MPVSTLTSKGQITLPQAVRTGLGIEAGDKIDFVEVEGGFKLVALRKDVRCLKGRFADRVDKPVTIEQMNQAIAQGAARRAARSWR